jgi:hypothetical protein
MSTFFEDSNIDDRDLFVGLQSLNDRHYDCQISCNRYGINISGLTTEVRRACASFAGIPTAPRTVVKRKRSDSFGHYDHDMDHVNTAGHVVEDYRAKELGSIYPEYEQLRTTMKKRQYVSYEDSVADDAESSFYWSDNMFGGRGSNHDTVPLSMTGN